LIEAGWAPTVRNFPVALDIRTSWRIGSLSFAPPLWRRGLARRGSTPGPHRSARRGLGDLAPGSLAALSLGLLSDVLAPSCLRGGMTPRVTEVPMKPDDRTLGAFVALAFLTALAALGFLTVLAGPDA